jgi:hypothetical protein
VRPFERELRSAVRCHRRHRHHAADRAERDDAAGSLRPHPWEHEPDELHGRAEVHVHLRESFVLVDVLHHGAVRDAGVVDQDVDAAPVALGLGDEGFALFRLGDIEGSNPNVLRLADRVDIEPRERALPPREKYPVLRSGQSPCHCEADACASARDQDRLLRLHTDLSL